MNIIYIVYADVSLCLNLLVQIVCMGITKHFLHITGKRWNWLFFGSLLATGDTAIWIGELASGTGWLLWIRVIWFLVVMKLFVGKQRFRKYLAVMLTMISSYIFLGGGMVAGFNLLMSLKLCRKSGIFGGLDEIAFPIPWYKVMIVFVLMTCFVGVVALPFLLRKKGFEERSCDVTLLWNHNMIQGKAIVDTGNSLCEPCSGKPVMVAEAEWLRGALSCESIQFMYAIWGKQTMVDSLDCNQQTVLTVPYQSVGTACGILPAFVFDQLIVIKEKQPIIYYDVIVAAVNQSLSVDHQYSMLLHNQMK